MSLSGDTRPAATKAAADALVPTVRLVDVLGVDDLASPDPTEDFHEASRLYPGVIDPLVRGASRLEQSAEMRASASRSVKRFHNRELLALPGPELPDVPLGTAVAARRSRRQYGPESIGLEALATLLHAAYGVTGSIGDGSQTVRTVPSGGALFPLELYVVCQRVADLAPALCHYDPLQHGLELVRPLEGPEEAAALTPYPGLVVPSAALVIVTAMFWRSRFKYGARAYRFALIEAGHLAQNFLLAAAALRLASTPLGGFYDRRVDTFLGIDGLYEAAVYMLPVGTRSA